MSFDIIVILNHRKYDKQQDRKTFFSQNDAEVMSNARKKLIKDWNNYQKSELQCAIFNYEFKD